MIGPNILSLNSTVHLITKLEYISLDHQRFLPQGFIVCPISPHEKPNMGCFIVIRIARIATNKRDTSFRCFNTGLCYQNFIVSGPNYITQAQLA